MLGRRKTSIETYFVWYYCYSTVISGNILYDTRWSWSIIRDKGGAATLDEGCQFGSER